MVSFWLDLGFVFVVYPAGQEYHWLIFLVVSQTPLCICHTIVYSILLLSRIFLSF